MLNHNENDLVTLWSPQSMCFVIAHYLPIFGAASRMAQIRVRNLYRLKIDDFGENCLVDCDENPCFAYVLWATWSSKTR